MCFLFLDPQNEVGPSTSSSVVLSSFVLLVYIVVLVLVFYLCPFSVRVVVTFSGTVLFPLLCSVWAWDGVVVKSDGPGIDSRWCQWGFFRGTPDRTMCPEVDSVSESEYQEFLLG